MAMNLSTARGLSSVLQKSFQSIRRDITQLKDQVAAARQKEEFLLHHVQELERSLSVLPREFVTADKLNLLKISIGDVREKLTKLDAQEKALSARAASGHASGVAASPSAPASSASASSAPASSASASPALASLRHELESRHSQWRANLRSLANTIDAEFEKINRNLETIQSANNKDISSRIQAFREAFEKKLEQAKNQFQSGLRKLSGDVATHQQHITAELQRTLRKSHAQELARNVNAEFNTLKEHFSALGDELVGIREELRTLHRNARDAERVQSQISKLSTNFETLRRAVVTDISETHDSLSRLGKKVREPIQRRELRSGARLLHVKTRTPSLIKASNTLIGVSFGCILLGIILFFALAPGLNYLVDWSVGIAVAIFVIGIIFRVAYAAKKK